ncbi:MAG TPA: malate synthase A [Gammaproteobacteria bacterium]|nr:malate synthase A [Gammaproteobacteria bacterium]
MDGADVVDDLASPIHITHPKADGVDTILTPAALEFVADLAERFGPRVAELLARRAERRQAIADGAALDFLPETRDIRAGDWRVGEIPDELRDRRVEITGPVERKMIINALNSGACVFMADFEDSLAPTWENVVAGQVNLRDAVRRTIEFVNADGKQYRLNDKTAVLMVRPRGWHLPEKHLLFEGQPIPAALVDFGLFFHHNARELLRRGSGPYLYLPKMESHLEARLWRDVFEHAERQLGLKHGSIRATVLIETLPAAFEMDEILYELRDYIVGLNCGRWDYIFSYIKTFRHRADHVLPDRGAVTMTTHFLRSYSQLLIKTCHRRGAFAMGGMAAQVPIKNDEAANRDALDKVRADKLREVGDGHDGTWVAHPGLVPVAMEVFNEHMEGSNQLGRLREDVEVGAADLLRVPEGAITEAGMRNNISVAIQYLAAWLAGSGCVPINHLMEDAATAEIARTQLWQWLRHGATLDDGRPITESLLQDMQDAELIAVENGGPRLPYTEAAQMLYEATTARDCVEFLTFAAYDHLR